MSFISPFSSSSSTSPFLPETNFPNSFTIKDPSVGKCAPTYLEIAFPSIIFGTLLASNSVWKHSKRPDSFINVPIPPTKLIIVWEPPSTSTSLNESALVISKPFNHKDKSNVTHGVLIFNCLA